MTAAQKIPYCDYDYYHCSLPLTQQNKTAQDKTSQDRIRQDTRQDETGAATAIGWDEEIKRKKR